MKRFLLVAAMLFASQEAFAMDLSSPDIAPGAAISMPQVYRDCRGSNISPALNWTGVPKEAKSLALTMYDTTVPGGFWHWIVYDIPTNVAGLAKGAGDKRGKNLPPGAKQATNSFGATEYDGPCPPAGPAHHYVFTLWGLDVTNVDPNYVGNSGWFESYLHRHAMAKAVFEGTFAR